MRRFFILECFALLLIAGVGNAQEQNCSVLTAKALSPSFASTFSGKRNVYLRVVLERRNGIDMRANVIPQQIIDLLEKQGKAVRPSRTDANVSYWAFFKRGDFSTCDIINMPSMADLPYKKLEELFSTAPRDGTKWKIEDSLVIGDREYSIRLLDDDDAGTGGKKGEVEIAVLKEKKKVYYYFGSLLE